MSFSILVTDESLPMRRLVCRFLEAVGVGRPVESENGEETLALLKESRFDLVIVEINMSGTNLSGVDLIKAIRDQQPDVSLIVMTTEADEEFIQSVLDAGATEYLVKPFNVEARQRLLELCHQERPPMLAER